MTLLVGEAGLGKSMLVASITAHVTHGTPWPDGTDCLQGSVLLCNAEDDPAYTISPRLSAHEADLTCVHLIQCERKTDSKGKIAEKLFTLNDVESLEIALGMYPDCKLIVVDPIGSYLAPGTNANSDTEVRSVLIPAVSLARKYGAALLVLAHNRKSLAASADDTVLGSRAFTGVSRSVLHLMKDPGDASDARRLLLPGKSNTGPKADGLAFTIADGATGANGVVVWEDEPVRITADAVMRQKIAKEKGAGAKRERDAGRQSEIDRATDFLKGCLSNGPFLAAEVDRIATAKCISNMTLLRAKKKLGVESFRPKNPGPWYWQLSAGPADEQSLDIPTVDYVTMCPDDVENEDLDLEIAHDHIVKVPDTAECLI